MGLNFHCVCHTCKVTKFLFRGKESGPMHDFYREHEECRKRDKNACEVQGDGHSEQDWMGEDGEYGEAK